MKIDLATVTPTRLILAFILVAIVLKGTSEFIDFILSKLNIYHKFRKKDEKIVEQITVNEEKINELKMKCNELEKYHNLVKEIEIRQLRNTLTRSCMDALRRGSISYFELESLNELFEIYSAPAPNGLGGNHYVHDLIDRVKKLPVVD